MITSQHETPVRTFDGFVRVAITCAAVVLLLLVFLQGRPVESAERPNIVLCMADDQGWGDVAYNGHPILQTPVLDEMAATGLRFDQFYAAAPVCSPTRFSVMTGRTPNRGGVFKWGYALRAEESSIAEVLKAHGYATGHFGKWHLGSVHPEGAASPGAAGFETWLSSPNFYENDVLMSRKGKIVRTKGESSMLAVDAALDFIAKATEDDRPFLAVVWFGNPHTPHQPTPELAKLYAGQPKAVQNYCAEVTGIDRAMGKLREQLRERNLAENTLLWYTSDNGARKPGSTGGLRNQKGSIYEGGLRVPAIIEWPVRVTSPRVTDLRCTTSDIYPTVLDLLDIDVADQPPLDGVSLAPLVDGELKERPAIGFWDYPAPGISTPSPKFLEELRKEQAGEAPAKPPRDLELVKITKQYPTNTFPGHAAWIDGDWKLHRIEAKGDKANVKVRFELYDLASDPKETKDVRDEHLDRAKAMATALAAWQESVVRSLNGEDY